MASLQSADNVDSSIDPAAPLRGVIVCCTSIPPEQRTEIASKTTELGGIHKYDLTPDVTHLVVGDYDTPKYRHVARERPDIKAMDPGWIEAISELWKNDDEIDFWTLEKEYQLKAFEKSGSEVRSPSGGPGERESLLICLTGFGEQRDDIANKITSNGGRYTGDLTRRCTHLIASKPEGKKFTAAKSWGVQTVTLDWLQLSIERGMILEEAKFDPLLPLEEQGVGAWVKRDFRRASVGKRSRSAMSNLPEEGARKLRKTASMKLNTQRNNIWGDILGRATSREYSFGREEQPQQHQQQQDEDEPTQNQQQPTAPASPENQGVFSSCVFFIHGFEKRRNDVLEQTIATLGGSIATTIDDAASYKSPHEPFHRFLVVPQTSQPDGHPRLPDSAMHVVTEFYIEQCLHNKRFADPSEQTLGRPFPLFPIAGFSDLIICSATFTGLELNQVARSVGQLGARFDEEFRKTTSVLVCKSLQAMRRDKLKYALEWDIPVVSADWLWDCICTGFNTPVQEYIFPELRKRYSASRKAGPVDQTEPPEMPEKQPRSKTDTEPATRSPKSLLGAGVDTTAFGNDIKTSEQQKKPSRTIFQEDSTTSADFMTARTRPTQATAREPAAPLAELSSASVNKSPSPPKSRLGANNTIARTISEPHNKSSVENLTSERLPSAPPLDTLPQLAEEERKQSKDAERKALTSKITTLIGSGATSTDESDTRPLPPARSRRRQILGRATSNASNGSSASADTARPLIGASTNTNNAIAEIGDSEDDDEQAPAPSTQLEYGDPDAKERKAELLKRMMGESRHKVTPFTSSAVAVPAGLVPPAPNGMGEVNGVSIVGGRALRRR